MESRIYLSIERKIKRKNISMNINFNKKEEKPIIQCNNFYYDKYIEYQEHKIQILKEKIRILDEKIILYRDTINKQERLINKYKSLNIL